MTTASTRSAPSAERQEHDGTTGPARVPIGLAPGVPHEAAGQDAAKYGSTNPVVQRLLHRWTTRLREVLGPVQGTVVDVGVGEGLCLERLLQLGPSEPADGAPAGGARHEPDEQPAAGRRPRDVPAVVHGSRPADRQAPIRDAALRVVGVEYRFDKARAAARRLPDLEVVVGDAGMLPLPDAAADLVTCIEVLEHLPSVDPAVAELARISRDRCIVSVPWEPWFRLGNLGRGKNIRRFGNDPEHVRAFTPGRLRRTMQQGFDEVRIVPTFPWLVAVARSPRR